MGTGPICEILQMESRTQIVRAMYFERASMMKVVAKKRVFGAVVLVLLTGLCLLAEEDSAGPVARPPAARGGTNSSFVVDLLRRTDGAGFLGVRLMPVPEMLAVHLGLDEGAGQMVINVVADSPADKAGLVRYDVITSIAGEKVEQYEAFVQEIKSAGAGAKVKLTVISGGKNRVLTIQLGAEPEDEWEWKYSGPPTSMPEQPKTKGFERHYRIEPFEDDDLPFGLRGMPEEFKRFFHKEYRFRYDPDQSAEGGIILPDEQTQKKLEELEERLAEVEQQQAQILEKLDRLLQEK